MIVGLTQQYANYYASSGIGDLAVIMLLALTLLVRPSGLARQMAAGALRRAAGIVFALAVLAFLAAVPDALVGHARRLLVPARQPRAR